MEFSENIDYGPRNRWLHFGDVPDCHLDPGMFLKDSSQFSGTLSDKLAKTIPNFGVRHNIWGNELLGGGQHCPSAFLVILVIEMSHFVLVVHVLQP